MKKRKMTPLFAIAIAELVAPPKEQAIYKEEEYEDCASKVVNLPKNIIVLECKILFVLSKMQDLFGSITDDEAYYTSSIFSFHEATCDDPDATPGFVNAQCI
ncbi:hypothetical protein MHU86_19030 [Fragilaria crotonensis]|nr:hypothetical protein MHU86_19030 [Fragilaria crotonensis]